MSIEAMRWGLLLLLVSFGSCSFAEKNDDLSLLDNDPIISKAAPIEAPLMVIDAHTHTRFTGQPESQSEIAMTEKEYFDEWAEAGVVGAVAHSGTGDEDYRDMKDRHVVHCAGVPPKVDAARIEAGLKSGKYGCLKIYLGYEYQYAYDPAYFPAYRLARKYGVPVVFHTGDVYDPDGLLKYSHPLTIDEVAVKFRDVIFVIAHMGNPFIQAAAEVAYKNSNVYLEGSAILIGDLSRFSEQEIEEQMVKQIRFAFQYLENPKKLMFGTDWPLTRIKPYLEAFKKAIPEEHWKAVFYENAMRVFKVPGLAPTLNLQ